MSRAWGKRVHILFKRSGFCDLTLTQPWPLTNEHWARSAHNHDLLGNARVEHTAHDNSIKTRGISPPTNLLRPKQKEKKTKGEKNPADTANERRKLMLKCPGLWRRQYCKGCVSEGDQGKSRGGVKPWTGWKPRSRRMGGWGGHSHRSSLLSGEKGGGGRSRSGHVGWRLERALRETRRASPARIVVILSL